MEAGAGRVRDDSPSQAEAVAEGQHQRQERRRRRRRRRASYHRTASSNLHQRGLRAYRVSIYSRNLIASLARVIRGDGEHAVAQIHDEESTNTEVFRMESGPVGVIQDIVVFIALVDTVIRAVAHVHAPILTHVDFINVFLTVTVALRLAFDWYDGNFIVPNFLHIWALRGAALSVTTGILRMCQRSSDIVELTVSMLNLILTLFCVVITSMCGVEHLEKGNENNFTLFTALWFVVVTFSTVVRA
ncbi:hypothetical protein PTSG_05714 [Salpingoeca rosetta]|uniref:Ion transport domain-containing protein n=1 Tax=Salpingoeca rosetta (strain ATCC 50818 / BSB-021) TaxID=946362 RepID=F2UB04_SALR5|nr:uncharacterized protein PTSG_05714 [Salpingoeca rosetta]EGD74017.1 hypothetical protein PTSG_05714 [Salpingoeca rosetta]|eukprot:XP_004993579.1 hypothetical protein PTSG_05714 [Salpingoeca rosetta]